MSRASLDYRARNVIEGFFCLPTQRRAIGTRFDKLTPACHEGTVLRAIAIRLKA
jgi:hypothetical protein